MRQLKDADGVFKKMGGILGASLRNTLDKVVHAESKRFASQMKQHPQVTADLAEGMHAEEARYRDARVEYVEQMKLKRENTLAKKALADTDRQLKKRKRDLKHQDKVIAAMTAS